MPLKSVHHVVAINKRFKAQKTLSTPKTFQTDYEKLY